MDDSFSYSETNTFKRCKLQHFYRYHVRIRGRIYKNMRHLVIGSITHEAIELLYKRHLEKNQKIDKSEAVKIFALTGNAMEKEYKELCQSYFVEDQFFIDLFVAKCLFEHFYNYCYRKEPWEIKKAEENFSENIKGNQVVGTSDQIYNVSDLPTSKHFKTASTLSEKDKGVYLGELKTRGASWMRLVKSIAPERDQVKLYLSILWKQGLNPKGVIYTVLKKPPNKLIFSDDPQEAIDEIKKYYKGAKRREKVRRDIIPIDIDESYAEDVFSNFNNVAENIKMFYEDVYENVGTFNKPRMFVCKFCSYKPICRDNQELSDQYLYKKKRDI